MIWVIMRESSDGNEVEVEEHRDKVTAERRLEQLRNNDTYNYYYMESR